MAATTNVYYDDDDNLLLSHTFFGTTTAVLRSRSSWPNVTFFNGKWNSSETIYFHIKLYYDYYYLP